MARRRLRRTRGASGHRAAFRSSFGARPETLRDLFRLDDAGGTYTGFTVTGTCVIDFGANVQINGDLTIAKGASLNDHGAELWQMAEMHITGNVKVGRGSVLLALQLGGITVGGNVISNGGCVLSPSVEDFRNFPIKDNVIHGNLIIQGWRGGWIGPIRNTFDRNVKFSSNVSHSSDLGPGTDDDSSEVMGIDLTPIGGPVVPQTIGGNLICHGNAPAAQVNPLDGGANNFVGGKAIGQCAGLAQ